MKLDLEFFLEGATFVVYWHRTGDRWDPLVFFESLPERTRASLAGSIQAFADRGAVPGPSSGHPERWYHLQPPVGGPGVRLFKFKEDPRIRFYAVLSRGDGEHRVVLVYGYQDPKKGHERDRHTQTGRATAKAERITLKFLLMLRQP